MSYTARRAVGVQALPILVVDDEPTMRLALTESLIAMGYATLTAGSATEALARCRQTPVSAVITDMKMGEMSGLDLLDELQRRKIGVPVILMSAFGTIDVAVSAMKAGVVDYLPKPFSPEVLAAALMRALPALRPSIVDPSTASRAGDRLFLTQDPAALKMLKVAESVAASEASILIEGESGTGKELIARLIHQKSPRASRPFVAVNCAAVPDGLIESELFGYEKGAFTGAIVRKPGRFEMAHTGTLLLDEVSELRLDVQAKLLRAIQEREVDPLGGRGVVPVDIRIIATTNRPLWDEVKEGRFREDLYYRLNVFPLRLPPLRARRGDIPLLVDHFIQRSARRNRRPAPTLDPTVYALLSDSPWRGNVRELENVIERAVLLADGKEITPEHLVCDEAESGDGASSSNGADSGTDRLADRGTIRAAERMLIMETLQRMDGNRTHAARHLGISLRTLRNKLREYRVADSDEGQTLRVV